MPLFLAVPPPIVGTVEIVRRPLLHSLRRLLVRMEVGRVPRGGYTLDPGEIFSSLMVTPDVRLLDVHGYASGLI